ncbi:beta-carotene 15,15'-monooxygenase, partial [Lactobacillus delbrueckii subsp. bulgaricus]|nr:beta-carotene 15,15'-monooxygenase [Lactobacillus delbrueckii subsp. bulgaricus]
IIWKQLKYRLIEILLSSLLPWACGSLTGMLVNGWSPTLGAVATEALIRCLYLILSCLALLLLTSFCFLISNRITAFLAGFVINGLSFFLNVNHHLSIIYDFVVPEFATLLFSCLPIMLGLLLFLIFIVQQEISRKDL